MNIAEQIFIIFHMEMDMGQEMALHLNGALAKYTFTRKDKMKLIAE